MGAASRAVGRFRALARGGRGFRLARVHAHGAVQRHAGQHGFDGAGLVVDDALEMRFKLAVFAQQVVEVAYKNRYSQMRSNSVCMKNQASSTSRTPSLAPSNSPSAFS